MVLAALIFSAVCIMAGLVIDLGISYVQISRLQTAADAAAFAAATLLPFPSTAAGATQKAQAEQMVRDYVLKNGDSADEVLSIDFTQDIFNDTQEGPLCSSVRVELQRNVRYVFAPIIGLDSRTISRPAKVRVEAVISGQPVAPLGISKEYHNEAGALKEIAFDPKDERVLQGKFGYLDLNKEKGDNGAQDFYDMFVNGYEGEIILDNQEELIESETGRMLGKASEAFNVRYGKCSHFLPVGCTPEHYVPTCPRVVILVVHEFVVVKPNHYYKPIGFAPYILRSFDTSLWVSPLKMRVKTGKSVPLTDLNYDFGLFRNRLVE